MNGLVTKPAGFAAGKKYPTLLYHPRRAERPGRATRSTSTASSSPPTATWCSRSNYRGSSGRGSGLPEGDLRRLGQQGGRGPAGRGGLGRGAAASPTPDRLGIGGWSYGGILTDYTIATDPRFKAAVSGASSALQMSMYGVDQYIVQYEHELGPPWKTPELWTKVSYPFFHADRIKTPTLFMCGQIDFNVPIAGVEQMYQALDPSIETQLVIYPDQHHGLTIPSYHRDRLQRYVAWWDSPQEVLHGDGERRTKNDARRITQKGPMPNVSASDTLTLDA